MNDRPDSQLLGAWVKTRSEPAFAELVRRHVDLVYSAAVRMVCDSHLAQDVSQAAFVALAQNAPHLTDHQVLSGWLHRTVQNLAANVVRNNVRRRAREQEAAAMNQLLAESGTGDSPAWEHIAPHLDAALGELSDPDRDAVLLRYFERRTAREMAQILGTSEDAAQKRVSRAVERLRSFFAKRGVTVGASSLAIVLSANAVQAAPVGLAVTISSTSLAAGAAGVGVLSPLTKTLIMTKTIATILGIVAVSAIVVPLALRQRHPPEPIPAANPPPTPIVSSAQENTPEPRPATPMAKPTTAPDSAPSQTLFGRVAFLPPLTPVQIENYVEQNKRNAESLLAAYRAGNNLAYLTEAATRFPNDPDVQYAVIAARPDPKIQRQWIDAYKSSSPDNALAWYFSALEYLKTGEKDLAIQEVAEATRKSAYRAELAPTLQALEELHLSAGRAADEAKAAALKYVAERHVAESGTEIPLLTQMRDLARTMLKTIQEYRQQGDTAAAEALAGVGLVLGSHLAEGGGSQTLVNQLVGIGIEKNFLKLLDPNGTDPFGRPVAEVSASVAQRQANLRELSQALIPVYSRLEDAELANYLERVKLYGEEAAVTWLKTKHEKP